MQGKKEILIKALGEIIKSQRIKSGKTMYKISAEAFMSKSTWREAELGVCKDINLSTIWKISEGLGVTPSFLMKELEKKLGINFTLSDAE